MNKLKGWHDAWNLRWTKEGAPVLVPFDYSGPFADVLNPIRRQVEPALSNFLFASICDIARAAESGYRRLNLLSHATYMMASRANAGCNAFPNGTGMIPFKGQFKGGQCDAVYIATIDRKFKNTPSSVFTSASPHVRGPIAEFRPIQGGSGSYSVEYRRQGSQVWQPVSGGGSVSPVNPVIGINGVSLVREDGKADDCGSIGGESTVPPPVNLPPPPSVGDVIYAPTWVNVSSSQDNDTFKFSVPIGAVIFGGEFGISFDVGGVGVRIGEGGSVQVGPFSGDEGYDPGGPSESPYLPGLDGIEDAIRDANSDSLLQLEDMERDLEKISETVSLMFPRMQGSFYAVNCQDEELEFPYDGVGFRGVESIMYAALRAIAVSPANICTAEDGGALGPLQLLATGAVQSGHEYRVVLLPSDIRRVTVSVEPGAHSHIYVLAGEGSAGNFGWLGAGPYLDGEVVSLRNMQISTQKVGVDIPESGWAVRLTMNRGVEYSVFGQAME